MKKARDKKPIKFWVRPHFPLTLFPLKLLPARQETITLAIKRGDTLMYDMTITSSLSQKVLTAKLDNPVIYKLLDEINLILLKHTLNMDEKDIAQ